MRARVGHSGGAHVKSQAVICLDTSGMSMTATKRSVAEAHQNFARLIKRAQQGRPIEITRRGESVAVLLSASRVADADAVVAFACRGGVSATRAFVGT